MRIDSFSNPSNASKQTSPAPFMLQSLVLRKMDVILVRALILFLLLAIAAGQNRYICPSRRYQLRESNGTSYCYLYVQSPMAYAAANRSCIRDGAILLSIRSADENRHIRENFFSSNNDQDFWIGLNDIIEEGTFRWENSSVNEQLPYANWSSVFPNDNRASLDCVKFSSDGWRIHNLPCGSSQLPFICKSNTCASNDGENCIGSVTTAEPAPLISTGGISAIAIVVLVLIGILIIVVILFCLWKFKNDIFNRYCCWCCGGGERSKVRNLQQENQRLRQQLSQHRLSVSGRHPPGQFARELSGVPDGRGGVLPPIKQPLASPDDQRLSFMASPVGNGPPPLNIQRISQTTTGPFIAGRPSITTPSGGIPRSMFTAGNIPARPARQSAPVFVGTVPQPLVNKLSPSTGANLGPGEEETKPTVPATVVEVEESESSSESDEEEEEEGEQQRDTKQDKDKDSQQE